MLPRRAALLAMSGSMAGASAAKAQSPDHFHRIQWAAFRNRFMAPEGRIIDTGNDHVSHTEGQGWAMLAAVRADDRASFEKLHRWTNRTLRRQGDELFAWRFRPGAARPVDDPNNATDGDLFIAWALLEAGRRWGRADCTTQGTAMARDILRLLCAQAGPFTVLLPGSQGFQRTDHTVVNPSYYAFPAIRALAMALPDPAWLRLAADGVALLRASRFGRWGLPPDWLTIRHADGALALPGDWAPRFSYDAVRVPLYLAWVGLADEPALIGPADFWSDRQHRHMPAWTDLTNDGISPYAASPGITEVARLTRALRERSRWLADRPVGALDMPNYYSAALSLLAGLAAWDSGMA
ncbi:glycosyl hydrolase family 8 [Roseococcus sp. YIM B11640]|uniref:glycosyl hydrolase family 8 n=1 Tax=Roseococcus sp. YIM B11640 TaxID=3133973 RepID=UPI003C7D3175